MTRFFNLLFGKNKVYYRFVRQQFGVIPRNIDLYKLALIHRSASFVLEDRSVINNERLEFLGDAVIDTIVSEMLFIDYPRMDEGELTQLRSRLVNRERINAIAEKLKIDLHLIANFSSVNGQKQNMYGDAFEALIGALYLDRGYNRTNRALISLLQQRLDIETINHTEQDFKSRIIEWGQKQHKSVQFSSSENAEFDEIDPSFQTELHIDNKIVGIGIGRSKKEAEQRAAQQFYIKHEKEF